MIRLASIMTKDVVTATPEMTLREAAELFSSHHISGAPVVSGRKVVGVVSAADILGFAASTRRDAPGSDSEPLADAWTEPTLDDNALRDGESPTSFFTELWSNVEAISERARDPHGSESDVLDDHTVDEIMSRPLVMLSSSDDVLRAATLMEAKSIHRVIVVDGDDLVGIVSTLDIVRAVAGRTVKARA
jgi:CBS domain-containing protein